MGLFDIFSSSTDKGGLGAISGDNSVIPHLKDIAKSPCKVLVKIGGVKNYTTTIANLTDKHIFLKGITPVDGLKLFPQHPDIVICYDYKNIFHSFQSKFIQFTNDKNFPIAITVPKTISRGQRRKITRATVHPKPLSANIYLTVDGNLKPFNQRIYDISEGGFSFCTTLPLNIRSKGQKVKVELILKDNSKVMCEGVVVHNDEMDHGLFRCGVKFENLTAAKLTYLRNYMAERQ